MISAYLPHYTPTSDHTTTNAVMVYFRESDLSELAYLGHVADMSGAIPHDEKRIATIGNTLCEKLFYGAEMFEAGYRVAMSENTKADNER